MKTLNLEPLKDHELRFIEGGEFTITEIMSIIQAITGIISSLFLGVGACIWLCSVGATVLGAAASVAGEVVAIAGESTALLG